MHCYSYSINGEDLLLQILACNLRAHNLCSWSFCKLWQSSRRHLGDDSLLPEIGRWLAGHSEFPSLCTLLRRSWQNIRRALHDDPVLLGRRLLTCGAHAAAKELCSIRRLPAGHSIEVKPDKHRHRPLVMHQVVQRDRLRLP